MRSILFFALVFSLFSCSQPTDTTLITNSGDKLFSRYKQNFVEELWKLNPSWASSVGYHRYDSVLIVPDAAQRERELVFSEAQLDSLARYSGMELSDHHKTDALILRDFLKSVAWNIRTLKAWQWDPSNYNVCGGFSEMLANNYDSLDTRLRNFYSRMRLVPAYYEAAKQNILHPTKEHLALAIQQNMGGYSVFEAELASVLESSRLDTSEKQKMLDRAQVCKQAVIGFAEWLKQLKNETPRDFRLGEELYAQKFLYDIQSEYRAEQIYEKALNHKKELHGKMAALTRQLWSKYFPNKPVPADSLDAIRTLIDRLSQHHVKADSFQLAIEQQIPELVEFVNQKKLIYLDPKKPLVVRREPAYMAGLAGASISSPGPYDKDGNTYYNVGSLAGWSKEKAESYLREYNHYILQILNIHEAIPGHYTQLVYANNSAGSASSSTEKDSATGPLPGLIKTLLGNGAMVEGWAVYSELMMLENGYGAKPGAKTAEPEMWLMYYKWNLRSTCNTILDYGVHVKGMSKEEALNLLTREAFQQQAEAEGKWRRVTLTQVQLCSYFTGFTEILEFREELKKEMGAQFDLKRFHEKFLSYGSAPVKYIKELMRAELATKK